MADWLCSNVIPGGCVSSVIVGCFREPQLEEVILNYGTSLQLISLDSKGKYRTVFQQPLFTNAKDVRCLPALAAGVQRQVCKGRLCTLGTFAPDQGRVLVDPITPTGCGVTRHRTI
jgi:hypothetical protein